MVKLFGAVMVGAACAYFGFKASFRLQKRARSLADISLSLELLESEIGFTKHRLKKALERSDRCGLFICAAQYIDEMGAAGAWKRALAQQRESMCLKDADCEVLELLGEKIGKTDTDDQIKHIKYVRALVEELQKSAGEDSEKQGKLFRGCGILTGLMLVIILI